MQKSTTSFRKSIIGILISLLPISLWAQTYNADSLTRIASKNPVSKKLTGTIIGTSNYVDYTTNTMSTQVNTRENVFDGDFSTFLATYERSGTWVGLDLGTPHLITKVGYSPRIGRPDRVLLAVIEGANNADFSDAFPLYIIPDTAEENIMTYADISCSKGVRYVRYVTPNDVRCNLSELDFYGYEGNGSNTFFYQPTNLPVVIINTKDKTDVTSKEEYIDGNIMIVSNQGKDIFSSGLGIRGRGNANWTLPKKPYRIKLNDKAKLLDFPAKAKSWTLVNNYGDKTLMRNLLAFDISHHFNMAYTPVARPVDLVLNGEYKGCYQLCDQVEVRENRVEVETMSDKDITLPNLSGGYYIEIDAYASGEKKWFTSSFLQVPVTIHYPDSDVITPEQTDYIVSVFNKMESVLFSSTYKDPTSGFRSKLDLESFLKHFIIGQLCGNMDIFWSVNMYKKRNNDLLYTGPEWDFDIAFDNDTRLYPTNDQTKYIFAAFGANGMPAFVGRVLSDPNTFVELKKIWSKARYYGGINADRLCSVADSLAKEIDQSQDLNFKRWNIMNTLVFAEPRVLGSYEAEVEGVKEYIRNRIIWLDNKIGLEKPSVPENNKVQHVIYTSSSNLILKGFPTGSQVDAYTMMGVLMESRIISEDLMQIPIKQGLYTVKVCYKGSILAREKVMVEH